MAVKVRIPTPLMKLTNNLSEVTAEGSTITEILNSLESQFAGIKERICEEDGSPRRFINIYVNEEDIRFLDGEKSVVKEGDEISIIPAIAGGVHR
jgi:molybdopterin converting factor small subunit